MTTATVQIFESLPGLINAFSKNFPAAAASSEELAVLRLMSKLKYSPKDADKKLTALGPVILENAKALNYVSNTNNSTLSAASGVLLALPAKDLGIEKVLKDVLPADFMFKGVEFSATALAVSEHEVEVIFQAKDKASFSSAYSDQIPEELRSQKKVYSVPLVVGGVPKFTAEILEDFQIFHRKMTTKIAHIKKDLEKRMLNAGFTTKEIEFMKSFW